MDVIVAMVQTPPNMPGDADPLGDVGSCPWGSSPINDSVISLKSMLWHFWLGPRSLWIRVYHHLAFLPRGTLGWGWAGVTLVTTQPFFHLVALSSSSAEAATMATIGTLGHPSLRGTHPTEATGWDEWISIHLGYSWPIVSSLWLVVTGRAVGMAGSLVSTASGVAGTAMAHQLVQLVECWVLCPAWGFV